MALDLAGAGCRVAITATRQPHEIAAVAAAVGGDHVLALTADMTREEDCARVVEATLSRFGRLDVARGLGQFTGPGRRPRGRGSLRSDGQHPG